MHLLILFSQKEDKSTSKEELGNSVVQECHARFGVDHS